VTGRGRGPPATDSVTSEGLARFLAAHGGVHLRAKKGYRSVIDAARRADADPALPPCHLAVEPTPRGRTSARSRPPAPSLIRMVCSI